MPSWYRPPSRDLCLRLSPPSEDPERPESVLYYTTSAQYAALLAGLDRADLEDALCMSLQELHYDIQRQMALTEEMTEQRLRPGAVSYLQQENGERGRDLQQETGLTPGER